MTDMPLKERKDDKRFQKNRHEISDWTCDASQLNPSPGALEKTSHVGLNPRQF